MLIGRDATRLKQASGPAIPSLTIIPFHNLARMIFAFIPPRSLWDPPVSYSWNLSLLVPLYGWFWLA